MIDTLLIAIVMLLVLLVFICGYILLHLSAGKDEAPHVLKKREKFKVQQSKENSAMEKALGKFDGGLSK